MSPKRVIASLLKRLHKSPDRIGCFPNLKVVWSPWARNNPGGHFSILQTDLICSALATNAPTEIPFPGWRNSNHALSEATGYDDKAHTLLSAMIVGLWREQ